MNVFYFLFYTAYTVNYYVCRLITKIKKLVLDDRYNNIHFCLGKSNTCSSKDVKTIRMIVLRDKFRDHSK